MLGMGGGMSSRRPLTEEVWSEAERWRYSETLL